MARVLISIFGSTGDVHPFLAVGRELAGRGHHVTCHANPYFERRVLGAGLDFVPLGTTEEYLGALADPRLMHRTRASRYLLGDLVARSVPKMVEFVRARHVPEDTVVIASATAVGALLAADLYRIPSVFVHLAPATMPSVDDPPTLQFMPRWLPRTFGSVVWRVADRLYDGWLAPAVNEVRRQHGEPPVERLLTRYFFRTPDLRVGLFPDWFAAPPGDWPVPTELLGFAFQDSSGGLPDDDDHEPIDAALADFLAAPPSDAPIAVSMGTANMHSSTVYAAAIEAGARLGRRVLVLTQFPDGLPQPLPPHALHVAYAPFSRVLPRCAALVHHGGVGTTAQALRAALPQVIVPRAYDQHDNGERVATLGCGVSMPQRTFGVERATATLCSLLESPATAEACRNAAAQFAADHHGVNVVRRFGDLVEGLVAARPRLDAVTP
ncbi:MAG: glycosyltransferase family 1 protein [Trueperaceae bacterium]|nr:glycosyltransferase family 1 protein [Trueperaceae bacterium]